MYLSGVYGYHSNLKRNLFLALLFFGITAVAIALPGTFGFYELGVFCVIKGLVGVTNAFIWPTIMTGLALWFPKKGRGIIVGLWATSNNLGHIGGAQIAAALLNKYDKQWWYLEYTAGLAFMLWAYLCYFFLVLDPADVGIVVNELTEEHQQALDHHFDKAEQGSKQPSEL